MFLCNFKTYPFTIKINSTLSKQPGEYKMTQNNLKRFAQNAGNKGSNGTSRRLIVDSIIDLVVSHHCVSDDGRMISVKSFSGKELRVIKGATYRRAIIDIRPGLTRSVSSAIGQIHTYAHFLSYCRWELGVKKTPSYPDMLLFKPKEKKWTEQVHKKGFRDGVLTGSHHGAEPLQGSGISPGYGNLCVF